MSNEALFQLMRLNILSLAANAGEGWPMHPAYVYEWQHSVYPLFDETAQFHKPFADQFAVSINEVDESSKLLDEHWMAKKRISFYKVEEALGVHGSDRSSTNWQRWKLIRACRYMYLLDSFDKDFWEALLEKGECPTEALSLARPMTAAEIQLT
jgi:antitoxin MazE